MECLPLDGNQLYAVGRFYGGDAGIYISGTVLGGDAGSLKGKAKTQVQRTKMFQKPLEYELSEEGVTVRQGELEVTNKWEDFSKAVSTNRAVILYVTRMRALIFPRESMEEQYEAAVKMISTHMPPKNVKIRHIAG